MRFSALLRSSLRALAVVAVCVGSAVAGEQDFTLINRTGVEIYALYASPHSSDDWEEEILGADTLPSGHSLDIEFHPREDVALWDLRVEDHEGNSIEWEKLNLLRISILTLYYQDGEAWAEFE